MKLSTTRVAEKWVFPSKAFITYRRAESLDKDIAETMASKYLSDVLVGGPLMDDFGFSTPTLSAVIKEAAKRLDDLKPNVNHFFAVALAERLIDDVQGFEVDGEPAVKSRKFFSTLLKDPATQDDWLVRSQLSLFREISAGNGSSAE